RVLERLGLVALWLRRAGHDDQGAATSSCQIEQERVTRLGRTTLDRLPARVPLLELLEGLIDGADLEDGRRLGQGQADIHAGSDGRQSLRSEEHTSELQSRENLV